MPRNLDGTSEIRELFSNVDDLNRTVNDRLVSADGQYLTVRGRRAQRNYENWRARKLVPSVLKNSPADALDAPYVARFFKHTDGPWLPNATTVLHIFAEGVRCPPEVIREATRTLSPQIEVVAPGDPGAIDLEEILDVIDVLIEDEAHGNAKHWRETPEGTRARTLEKTLATGTVAASVNEDFVSPTGRDPAPKKSSSYPALAQLLAPLISHYVGPLTASDLYDEADSFTEFDHKSVLQAFGVNVTDFTADELVQNRRFLRDLTALAGPALDRIRDDPESIAAKMRQLRPVVLVGARMFPDAAKLFGIRATSQEPRYLAFLDTLIILGAAIATEREQSK